MVTVMASAQTASADPSQGNAPTTPNTSETTANSTPQFPPPKTDKPRPHVCNVCQRAFARLEHLKRHERSHTKEKPFECPICQRRFARRDLLLRHQQKLHQTGQPSRPRSSRRDSTTALPPPTSARARKNSMASSIGPGNVSGPMMRPRANTISHIDTSHGLLTNSGRPHGQHGLPMFGHQSSVSIGALPEYTTVPMSAFPNFAAPHGIPPVPKIETSGLGVDVGGGLRTAPLLGHSSYQGFEKLFGTVNPAQLHFGHTGDTTPASPYTNTFPPLTTSQTELEANFGWDSIDNSFLSGPNNSSNDYAIDQSSPSAFSAGSASAVSEMMIDGSNNPPSTSGPLWPEHTIMVSTSQFVNDPITPAIFSEFMQPNALQTGDMHNQGDVVENYMSLNGHMSSMSPVPGTSSLQSHFFQPRLTFGSDTTSVSSLYGSGPRSSITTSSTESITDATRQALLFSLSQGQGFSPIICGIPISSATSPTTPRFTSSSPPVAAAPLSLPSTADLRRYVHSYIIYFHPHMPFLHLSTMRFDSPAFTINQNSTNSHSEGIVDGAGCLVLAMAAIGASYEFEHEVAMDLFEHAKTMIKVYLDRRQRRSMSMMASNGHLGEDSKKTPLWIVQAMLLNIIFGHQCGERVPAEIATTHCASLVSLAKQAQLEQPDPDILEAEDRAFMARRGMSADSEYSIVEGEQRTWRRSTSFESREAFSVWFRWKSLEERKRTLFSVYILSSLLVTAYNQHPRILNSELHVDLPCEEIVWAAENPTSWAKLGGPTSQAESVSFADALKYLLNAGRRKQAHQRSSSHQTFGSSVLLDSFPMSNLRPSTFACYVLINALHVSIWELRQNQNARERGTEETEKLRAQIEPALRAWQAAWGSNPNHILERPNPYGPLPADSIPLLDLAYVRLFVNLGKSKELFWSKDFEAMAEEFATGPEVVPHSSGDESEVIARNVRRMTVNDGPGMAKVAQNTGRPTKRERNLRKAAFYAADSLIMANRLGVTFAEFSSRELPIQAAMCTFDCAQVLAEWLITVQERTGRYLNVILGRDEIDTRSAEMMLTLEEEDFQLLLKVNDILSHAGAKIAADMHSKGDAPEQLLITMKSGGYGYHLLMVTAYMLDKAAVWRITRVMAEALRVHATKIKTRAEASLITHTLIPQDVCMNAEMPMTHDFIMKTDLD